MLYFTKSKGDCTGCSACYSVCPVRCIEMKKDEEGFLYPTSSDECVHCEKCKKVCPIENPFGDSNNIIPQKAYCVLTKNKKIWKRSASGGAFSEICKAFGDDKTVICGAAWDGFEVKHTCVIGVNNIKSLCKSKYVASSAEEVFSEIKDKLNENKKVIFCGTPCQVAGLKGSLDKEYDNLLLIDLICHGVGSADVFKSCITEIEEQFNKPIIAYEFRAKRSTHQADYLSKVTFFDGSNKYITNDQYIQLFLKQNCLRPSCGENCRYRNEQRQGDITIADFKGLTEIFPNLKGSKRNYSSVIINTTKADSVVKKMLNHVKYFECEIDDIKKYNPLFFRQTWASKDRDAFFADYLADKDLCIKKWTTKSTVSNISIKRRIYDIAPVFIRRLVLKEEGCKHCEK